MDKCHRAVVVHPEQRRQEINHIADLECRVRELEAENVRLKEAMREQFLLQYGKEPDDLQRIVDKLVRERAERIELDNYLEFTRVPNG